MGFTWIYQPKKGRYHQVLELGGLMVVKGVLKAFDSGTYKATVEVDSSIASFLTGVAVSRAIPSAEMVAGRTVAVLFFSPDNPDDAMIAGVF